MVGSRKQQLDQMGGPVKRISDDAAVCQRHRGEQLAVDLGEQDGVRRRRRTIECGKPSECLLVGRRPKP